MGEPGCRWIGRAANPGIQMGKTPLCTDAAEPVAGGATADKYVSRQHHGSVAHRAEARSLRYPGRAAPRCPRHTTSCTARRTSQFLFGTRCLSSLSLSLLRFPQGSSLAPSLSVSIRFFLSFLLFLLFPLSFSPSTASRRISLPRTSLPLSFYSGSPGGSVPRFYIVHLNIMEMSTLSSRGRAESYCRASAIRPVVPREGRSVEKNRPRGSSRTLSSGKEDSPSPPPFLSDEYIS